MPLARDPTQSGFSVSAFRAYKDKAGLLRTHDFEIMIPWPPGLIQLPEYADVYRNMFLTCDSINFPATGTVTYKVQHYSYGALETKPTIPRFSDLHCTFLCDRESNIWKFFSDWIRLSVNFDFDPNPIVGGNMDVYEISYTEEYTVDLFLYVFDPHGTLVRKVGFRRAYPTMMDDIPLSWGAGNQMIRVPVTFAFTDWSEESIIA